MYNQNHFDKRKNSSFDNRQFFSSQNNQIQHNRKKRDFCFQKLQSHKISNSLISDNLITKNLQFPLKEQKNDKKYQSNKHQKAKIIQKLEYINKNLIKDNKRSNSVILDMPIKQSKRNSFGLKDIRFCSINDINQPQDDSENKEQKLKIQNLEKINFQYRNLLQHAMSSIQKDSKTQNLYEDLNRIYLQVQQFEKEQKAIYKEQIYNLSNQNSLNQEVIQKLENKLQNYKQKSQNFKETQQKHDMLQQEINILNDIIQQKNNEIEKLVETKKNNLANSQSIIEQVYNMNQLVDSKNQDIKTLQNQIQELNKELQQNKKFIQSDLKKNDIQNQTLQAYEKRIYNLNIQLKNQKNLLDKKDIEIQQLDNLYENFKSKFYEVESQMHTEQKSYQNLITQVSELNQSKVQNQQKILQLTQLLKQKDFDNNKQKKEITQLQEEINFLEQFQTDQNKAQQSEKFLDIIKKELYDESEQILNQDQTQQKQNQYEFVQDKKEIQQDEYNIDLVKTTNKNTLQFINQNQNYYDINQDKILIQEFQNQIQKMFSTMQSFPVDQLQLQELINKKQNNPNFVLKYIKEQILELLNEKDFQIKRLQKNFQKKQIQFFEEKEQLQNQLNDLSEISLKLNEKIEKESCTSSKQFSEQHQQELLKQLQYLKQQNRQLVGQNLQLNQNSKSIKTEFKISDQSDQNKHDSSFLTQMGKRQKNNHHI